MKKFVIMMILILTGQAVSSQIVTTDTQNKTITLDREAAIDKAKIIENEKALYEENQILKEYVKKLEASNQNLQEQVAKLEKDVVGGKDKLIEVQSTIIADYDKLRKIEEDSSDYGIYFNSGYGFNDIGIAAGGSLITKNMSYSVLYNPMMKAADGNSFPAIQLIVGFKIF